jgi:hypothetical protein
MRTSALKMKQVLELAREIAEPPKIESQAGQIV